LVDEVLAHFLEIFLVYFKLLNLFADWSLDALTGAPSVQFKLLLLVLFVLAVDEFKQVPGPRFEVLVHVNIVPFGMADLLEAVHVELADKGSKVAMLEVDRQNLLRKLGDVFDCE
jgi:hypothetical protein